MISSILEWKVFLFFDSLISLPFVDRRHKATREALFILFLLKINITLMRNFQRNNGQQYEPDRNMGGNVNNSNNYFRQNENIQCWSCSGYGHIARDCRNRYMTGQGGRGRGRGNGAYDGRRGGFNNNRYGGNSWSWRGYTPPSFQWRFPGPLPEAGNGAATESIAYQGVDPAWYQANAAGFLSEPVMGGSASRSGPTGNQSPRLALPGPRPDLNWLCL